MKYLLDGKAGNKDEITHGSHTSSQFDPLAASSNALPVGFRIFIKSKMNTSQLAAITAAAREYGDGGFTLIKGPPGTGKSTTLVSVLNALHLRQYQAYYAAIERIVTESNPTTHFEELAALNRAAEVKPRILVCAPSNAAIDNVIVKIMSDRFVDGNGAKYSPSIVRVGAGIVNPKVKGVGLKEMVDSIITLGSDVSKLEAIITTGRQELRRIQKEIQKLKIRIQAIVNACPYEIPDCWEIRIDEESFEATGSVLFVNHKSKKTTYDLPMVKRPTERPCQIKKMPHYVELLKNLTKYVERHNIESSNLEKYIILQNAANAKMEGGSSYNESTLTQELETHVLNSNHIVLTTLGSSGSRVVADANKFEVVVIDEAAQSSEPSTLVALQLGSSHAILVGDPQQLPATIFSVSGRNTKYDRSLFQRLEECGHPVHMLNTQYRMHPVISAFPRHIFYDGMLQDGSNVKRPDFGGNLVNAVRNKFPNFQPFNIFDLDSKEERDGTSLSNMDEAQLVLHLYRTLDRETDGMLATTRVAVITPYSQQTNLLHRLFENAYGMSYASRVEISTVDAFQGREAAIVIYSCVRAGRASGIGFLSDVQRMNVALTRAQNFLFVIARRRSIMVNPYWRKLVGYARERSAIIHVPLDRRRSHPKAPNDAVFPELTRLAPVHRTSDIGAMSDSEYSA